MGLSYEARLISRYAGVASRLGKYEAPKPRRVALLAPAAPVVVEPLAEPVRQPVPVSLHALRPASQPVPQVVEAEPAEPVQFDAFGKTIPHWRQIMREVCAKHGVTAVDLTGARRDLKTVIARYEAAYRMRHETEMSLEQIGKRLGGRDHTTILAACRRHQQVLDGTYVRRQPQPQPYVAVLTKWTPEREQKALALRAQGMSFGQIAVELRGANYDSVRKRLRKLFLERSTNENA